VRRLDPPELRRRPIVDRLLERRGLDHQLPGVDGRAFLPPAIVLVMVKGKGTPASKQEKEVRKRTWQRGAPKRRSRGRGCPLRWENLRDKLDAYERALAAHQEAQPRPPVIVAELDGLYQQYTRALFEEEAHTAAIVQKQRRTALKQLDRARKDEERALRQIEAAQPSTALRRR
jgi:hypothetical protein